MNDEKLSLIADIIHNVSIEPSVLLLSSKPISEHAKTFCQLPWSCVYTTCTDDSITDCFEVSKRRVRDIVSESNCDSIRLNNREMPLVYLMGKETDEIDPLEQFISTQTLLETIPNVLTTYGRIIIDCASIDVAIQKDLLVQISKIKRKGSIVLLGASNLIKHPFVQRLLQNDIAIAYDESVWQILDLLLDSEFCYLFDDLSDSTHADDSGNTFFIRKKSYNFTSPLEKELLINVSNFATLLNYEEVETSDRFPESETIQRFQLFLQNSSVGRPQWYGFRKDHNFHLTRYFEDDLYKKTIDLLESAATRDREKKPIILRGQACSGKTNALCALAYRVFHDHNYPVVYIHDPDVDLSIKTEKNEDGLVVTRESDGYTHLEALLRQIELKSDNPIPTLIIWDTSCRLHSEISNGYDLLKHLRSAGRLVQVICTSYEIATNTKKGGNPFGYYDVIDVNSKLMGPKDLQGDGDVYDEHEKVLQMLVKFGGFRISDAERIMQVYGASNTFIASLYLFRELHRNLKLRLRRENEGGIEGIIAELQELSNEEKERRSREQINKVMAAKLRKELERVGWQLKPEEETTEETDNLDDQRDDVRNLVCCIALCTLYKERLPMTMAVKLLGTIDAASSRIFKVVTQSAILQSDMSSDDEPMVSLRSELEAKLLLEAYDVSDAGRIELVEDLIDIASSKEDSKDVRLIQRIIQIIGPNNKDSSLSLWRDEFEGFLDLVETLEHYREDANSTALLLQELTLRRELCNHTRYQYDVAKRIEQLQDVQSLAEQMIKKHSNSTMTSFLANLYVEWANTTLRLSQTGSISTMANVYKDISRRMELVISQFPKNGFAYSAYLWAGINYAKSLPDADEKGELLQILGNIADTIKDESGDVTPDTRAFAELDSLIDKINISDERFTKSIIAGKSYGLYFRIRELIGNDDLRIDFTMPLPDKASYNKRCRKIVNMCQEYRPIIEKDAACMYSLLNVKWLLFTKQPIIPDKEDTRIRLSLDKWEELYNDCSLYLDKLSRFRSPRIVFLQALAAAHIPAYRNKCEALFDELRKGTNVEIRSYYVLCNENGEPLTFDGQLKGKYDTYKNRGYVKIDAVGFNREIYFRADRIGRKGNGILEREKFKDLSIAVGYRGFQVCKL